MWGQDSAAVTPKANGGIIPTRVGTSLTWLSSDDVAEDHPHACGDKRYAGSELPKLSGSSPRVWGQSNKAIPR